MGLSYGQISVSDVIARAKMQLGLSGTTDNDIWFETLANEAARHLDCLSVTVKRTCKIDIDGSTVCLPKGFKQFVAFRFLDNTDVDNGTTTLTSLTTTTQLTGNIVIGSTNGIALANNSVYADLKFLGSCGASSNGWYDYYNLFEIQNGMMYFHGTPVYTQGLLSFMGFNVDSNGMMLIYEDYERAMWNYICWMFCLQNFDRYPANLREEYRMTWTSQKAWLKSEEVVQHFKDTKRQVSEWANTLVSDKNWTI